MIDVMQGVTLDRFHVPRLRFGLLLWVAGMLGVVAAVSAMMPQALAEYSALPIPVWVIYLISMAQSAVLVALAVWVGVALAPAVGLRAPAFEAVATVRSPASALRPQLMPGLAGGALVGVLLVVFGRFAPSALAAVPEKFELPLLTRVLYGGITEELLLRWGFMTLLVWLAWRFLQGRQGSPRPGYVWLALALAAVLFGVGHLPRAAALVGELNGSVVAYVVCWNAVFGLLLGYLFWRRGLEAAMIAHAVAHVVNYLAELAGS